MSDNKTIIKKEDKSFGGKTLYYSTLVVALIIIAANLYGIYYVINAFGEITTGASKNVPADSSLTVPALNTSLYNQVNKTIQERTLYQKGATIPTYNYPEIFEQPTSQGSSNN